MPIYEYRCEDCGNRFEKLVLNKTAELSCPSCGHERLVQELSVFATRSGASREPVGGGGCPAGMCRTPDICGRN